MNKLYSTAILCLLSTINIYSQTYHSIISTKSLWTSIDCFKISSIETKSIRKEMMYGDTVILGKTYKKVYRDTSATFNWTKAKYICAVREVNKQIFYIDTNSTTEHLLYDFTKQIGDSVEVLGLGLNYPNKIKLRIDNIFTSTINGIDRKTYQFNANGSYHMLEYWYEGIGSSFGFLTPFHSVSDNQYTLKCNSINDTLFFLKSDISSFLCSANEPTHSCEYKVSSNINEVNTNDIQILPNPTTGIIIINSPQKIDNAEVFNNMGQLIMTSYKSQIDLSAFPNGLYYVEITNKNKQKVYFKLVKKD